MRPSSTAARLALGLAVGALVALGAACETTTYRFEPVDVGGDPTGAARPKTNGQWLRALFADVLGRAPESYDFEILDGAGNLLDSFPVDEERVLLGILENLGDPAPLRAIVAAGLTASPEAALPEKDEVEDPGAFIGAQFEKYLGRPPVPYERAAFLAEWEADPAVNPRTVVRALVTSREYQSF
jgi:hypothetical protein